jgi:hypothetical protein
LAKIRENSRKFAKIREKSGHPAFKSERGRKSAKVGSGNFLASRVARWFLFEPKIPIWVNLGGYCNGRCWYILWPFGQLSGHLAYLMAIWYMLHRFGTFYTFWYVVPRRIWQPCSPAEKMEPEILEIFFIPLSTS